MAKKKGKVHDVFTKTVERLADAAVKISDAFKGSGNRVWVMPEELEDKDIDDIPKRHDPAFNRAEMNANYADCLASGIDAGTGGDASGLKTQIDFVAMEEQAFAARHASIVRCFVHGHARLVGHGDKAGVLHEVAKQAADHIASGGVA